MGDLFDAIHEGDCERIRELLKQDPSRAAARSADGISALMAALYRRKPEVVELLLASVPELDIFEAVSLGERALVGELLRHDESLVHAWSADGFSPLHFAAFFDHPRMVERLIRRGGDPAVCSRNGMESEPLHSAAAGRSTEGVRVLLQAGADPNARQRGDWTALHAAAQHGDSEMARMLVEAGADLHAKNEYGRTPIDIAHDAGHESVL